MRGKYRTRILGFLGWGGTAVVFILALAGMAQATPIDLGSAGPQYWAVLGLGGGYSDTDKINSTKVTISGPSDVGSSVPGNPGNIGVAAPGSLAISGSSNVGDIFLGSGVTYSNSSSGAVGTITNDYDFTSAIRDAINGSDYAAGLAATNTAITKIDDKNAGTITGTAGMNVLNIDSLVLTGKNLTLSAPEGGTFVINVSGKFSISGGYDILLADGLDPLDVIFNIYGTGEDVTFSGGTDANGVPKAWVSGILLAPQRKVKLAPGLIVGEVIGGGAEIGLSSGGQVMSPAAPVPEPSTLLLLGSGLAGLAGLGRKKSGISRPRYTSGRNPV